MSLWFETVKCALNIYKYVYTICFLIYSLLYNSYNSAYDDLYTSWFLEFSLAELLHFALQLLYEFPAWSSAFFSTDLSISVWIVMDMPAARALPSPFIK